MDVLAFLHVDVHATSNGVFLLRPAVFALDVNLAHALADFAIFDHAIDFADDGGIFGLAGLKELDNARQTAGDVLGLGGFPRNLSQDVARLDLVAIRDHKVGPRRHEVLLAATAGGIAHLNGRLMLFVAGRQRDDKLSQTGDFVDLFFDGDAGLQILELDRATDFGEDREGERIPLGENLADVDRLPFVHTQARTVNDVVTLLFAALFVHDSNQAGPVHGDQGVVAAVNGFE